MIGEQVLIIQALDRYIGLRHAWFGRISWSTDALAGNAIVIVIDAANDAANDYANDAAVVAGCDVVVVVAVAAVE